MQLEQASDSAIEPKQHTIRRSAPAGHGGHRGSVNGHCYFVIWPLLISIFLKNLCS